MIIDGKKIAEELRDKIKGDIKKISDKKKPGLAVILIGEHPASQIYVRNKEKFANEVGINSSVLRFDENISEEDLKNEIKKLNNNSNVHGILVQLPLPKHINQKDIIQTIDPTKDVDGFHPVNLGRLVQGRSDGMVPCTPAGVMEMLRWAEVDLTGKKAVVLGRSFNVGMPQALLLAARGVDATVTVVHSRTKDAKSECLQADVIVAAVGRPEMIQPDWVKKGAIVVDVGINRIEDSSRQRGWRLAGDVHPDVALHASLLSPVPGGVGPMTVAMLMANTVTATERLGS